MTSRVGNTCLIHHVASRSLDRLLNRLALTAMPLNTRSSQSTQPVRTQRRKHGRRGAQDSEDDADDAPANTQTIGEDDDLDETRGVNNEVGHTASLPPSR